MDVGRQLVVEAPAKRFRREARVELEVRHLRERVHACVGPARAVQLELAASGDLADGAVDFALHRARVLLDLPAAVPRAGVLDHELESRHQCSALRALAILAARRRGTKRTAWAPILLAMPGIDERAARPSSRRSRRVRHRPGSSRSSCRKSRDYRAARAPGIPCAWALGRGTSRSRRCPRFPRSARATATGRTPWRRSRPPSSGPGWNAAVEATFRMRPRRRSSIPGSRNRVSIVSATTFTCSMRDCSCGFARANSPDVPKPALLTNTSMPIRRSARMRATSSAAPGSDRSMASTVAVILCAADSSSARVCSFAALRASSTRSLPPAAIRRREILTDSTRRTRHERDFRHDAIVQSLELGDAGEREATEPTGSTRRHEDERRRTKPVEARRPADRSRRRPNGRRVGIGRAAQLKAPTAFYRC